MTEAALKVHHERESLPYPDAHSVIEKDNQEVLYRMQDYFVRSEMEILVVVEGKHWFSLIVPHYSQSLLL